MWFFKAYYYNMDTGKEIVKTIKFDGQFFTDEKECYMYAMSRALEITENNEVLTMLEFIVC